MGSVGEVKHQKASVVARTAANAAARERANDGEARPAAPKYQRRITGLDWLLKVEAIDHHQHEIGLRYGRDFRFSIMESGAQLRSSLDFEESGVRRPGGGLPSAHDCSFLIVEARQAITLARAALAFSEPMILSCDLVCGRGMTPREITEGDQRKADQVVDALRIALEILARHYSDVDLRR